MSWVLGFSAPFFPWQLNVTGKISSKFLLVLQQLLFCLEPTTTFATLVGVDVIGHYRSVGVHGDAMAAKS